MSAELLGSPSAVGGVSGFNRASGCAGAISVGASTGCGGPHVRSAQSTSTPAQRPPAPRRGETDVPAAGFSSKQNPRSGLHERGDARRVPVRQTNAAMRFGVADVARLGSPVNAVMFEAERNPHSTPTGLFGPGLIVAFSSVAFASQNEIGVVVKRAASSSRRSPCSRRSAAGRARCRWSPGANKTAVLVGLRRRAATNHPSLTCDFDAGARLIGRRLRA